MAATIVATAGSASANSYVLLTEANAYFDERLQVANWTAASDDDKNRALIQATRWLDRFDFMGERSTTAQALEWPRIGAYTKDGYEYDTDSVPTFIKHTACELALKAMNDDAGSSDPLASTGLEGFDRAKVGPIEVEVNHSRKAGALPDPIKDMIRHVLVSTGFSVTLERA